MALKLNTASLNRVLRNIKIEGDKLGKKAGAALFIEGQEILTRSRQDFVPTDLGILKSDSGVTPPSRTSKGPEVTIWYGAGPAKDYAVVQHERTDFKHDDGGPFYLERPLLEAVSGMAKRLGRKVKLK